MVRVEPNYTVIFVTSLVTTVSYMQFLLLKCKEIQQIHRFICVRWKDVKHLYQKLSSVTTFFSNKYTLWLHFNDTTLAHGSHP